MFPVTGQQVIITLMEGHNQWGKYGENQRRQPYQPLTSPDVTILDRKTHHNSHLICKDLPLSFQALLHHHEIITEVYDTSQRDAASSLLLAAFIRLRPPPVGTCAFWPFVNFVPLHHYRPFQSGDWEAWERFAVSPRPLLDGHQPLL